MALYDSPDLLARFKRLARRPANDAALQPEDIYRYLTDAHLYWLGQFQVHFPRLNASEWEKMTSADGGKSYTFSKVPLGPVEIFSTRVAHEPLRAGAQWDLSAGFFWEGPNTIRIPGDRARSFADGPYARYLPRPDPLSESVHPVLQPPEARKLLVFSALGEWAHEGGLENPELYEDMVDALWLGKRPGDTGILGQLKARYAGNSTGRGAPWYKSPDLSNFPVSTS